MMGAKSSEEKEADEARRSFVERRNFPCRRKQNSADTEMPSYVPYVARTVQTFREFFRLAIEGVSVERMIVG